MDENTQDQTGSPGLVEQLVSLLSPQSAEAAAGPVDPTMQRMRQQQLQMQLQARQAQAQQQAQLQAQRQQQFLMQQQVAQQRMQQSQLQQQLTQQKIAAGAEKAKPGPSISSILGAPEATPASRARGPEAPIFRGTAPSGTPWYGNVPPSWASPQQREQITSAQPAPAPAAAPGAKPTLGGAPDVQAIEKLGQFNAWAEKNKIPSKIRAQMSDTLFPWAKEEKSLTPEQAGKMFKYDPETLSWAPLQPADYDKPVHELMKQGYRITTQQQQDASKSLPAMVQAFSNLEDAYGKISKQGFFKRVGGELPGVGSYVNPEAADYLKSAQQFTTFFDAEVMGKRGAGSPQMQQIRARVLPQLATNPEIGKKLLGDFKQLMGVIKDNQVRMYSGQAPDFQKEESLAAKINSKVPQPGLPGAQVGGMEGATPETSPEGWQTVGGIKYRMKGK